ncbi:MAG: ribosome assembly RNA-binding protein YhbY [Clostridia bacterium]|nr:ribosome assembly RNA-binding protein YhbY [Clostridia bacterium]
MTSKQRAYLRSLAANTDTIFQIGKGGVKDETAYQISNALEARELIKIRVLENCDLSAREAGEDLARRTGAELVCTIGSRIVLYRESKDSKRIFLP